MKKYIRASNSMPTEQQIQQLFDKENISYEFVEQIDDNVIMGVLSGDWKNNNDYGDELVKSHFNPVDSEYEDLDPYEYLDEERAEVYSGSDSCVTRYIWTW